MKEFGKIAAFTIIAIALSVLATLAIIKWEGKKVLPEIYDSATEITQLNNPVMHTVPDAYELRAKMLEERSTDSLFLAMSNKAIHDVVSVLNNKGVVDIYKKCITDEYLSGKGIYDNLPPNPDAKSDQTTTQESTIAEIKLENVGTTTVTEAPPTRVDNSNADTIIDGKHYKKVE
jgi:hypothetical protein